MAKAVIFLADGMADEPIAQLGGKTPLEAAETPAMDRIAARGINGTFFSLPEGFPTSSDAANMSVLGYNLARFYPGRGPIEAVSQGINLGNDDIAWRCNLVYVDGKDILVDYSAGHIDNAISSQLIRDLQEKFGSADVTFYPGVSYRNLLVLHGRKFSAAVDYFKPDSSQGEPVAQLRLKPLDDSPEAAYTVEFLEDLGRKTAAFLARHPLTQGVKNPGNRIWPWSPGHRPNFIPFAEKYAGRTAAVISAVDVIRGIGKCAQMDVIEVPGATGFIDTNYEGKAQAAIKALADHDLVYLHVEAIDECSHMGDLELKMRAIRDFDQRIVAPVMGACGDDVIYAVLPDHPVPLRLKAHTRTPVPVAICGPGIVPDGIGHYSETLAPQGTLGALKEDEFIRFVLGLWQP
ncbi:MAG: cofactor-independent phosphoglycerate mutase [Victivallales bacterium]|nr:cofactor-independent phosphoglycerate mutase [Victivallales bacterium]